MYHGYNLLYGKCVCRECYDQWREYMGMLALYTLNEMDLANNKLDCEAYGNPKHCRRAEELSVIWASIQSDMREHGRRLVQKCSKWVRYTNRNALPGN